MFWEKAPNCLQRFNPGHNLLPKNLSVKFSKPEIDVIVTNEEIGIDNNEDSDNDDNWWKQSAPGPSLQMCSGNQKWYCEVHRVPLNKTFDPKLADSRSFYKKMQICNTPEHWPSF